MEPLNFFDYTDNDSVCGISRAVRNNDEASLRKILISLRKKTERSSLAVDNRGWTAVHVATSRPENNECLELLLRFGQCISLDLNARSFDGKTALFIACEEDCEKNVLSLLKRGSDVNAKTLDGTSPLHVASIKGYVAIVRLLFQYGVAVNEQDWQGFTSLHLTALYGRFPVCQVLLENHANTLLSDSDGNLALHLACQRGHFDIVQLLFEKSENEGDKSLSTIDRQNNDGMTPLMLAVRNSQNEHCVNYLLRRGANTNTQNKDGFVALQYAAVGGNENVLRTLLNCTEFTDLRENCFRQIERIFKKSGLFYPVICCALNSGSVDCLTVLVKSTLDRMILEAPYVENDGHCLDVFSPLAYLFSVGCDLADQTFNALLNLLLAHNIVYANALTQELKLEWPLARVNYANPCAIIFNNSQWPDGKKFAYLNALNEHGVTFDYCLKCYNHTATKFEDFDILLGYTTFYKPLLDAVCDARVDIVDLFLSHSCIIEPDRLCHYLIANKIQSSEFGKKLDGENLEKIRSMYYHLVELKPSLYNSNRYGDAARFFEYFSKNEEFNRCNLQQLCRNVIRQQLRGDTLLDNLRNFHSNILALPLPTYLKDYLLFRN